MIPTDAKQDLEAGIDAIVNVIMSGEFSESLQRAHDRQAVKFPIRFPEYAYVDEVETPDGYPCVEIVAASTVDNEQTNNTFVHELSIQWTVNGEGGAQQQQMSRELKRLIVATRDLFSRPLTHFVGSHFWTGRADYGPTSPGRDQPYVKSAALRVFWQTQGL